MGYLRKNWILVFGVLFGIFVGLPLLAPLFMHLGWTGVGNAIYFVYSFLCHQLPERSYFLFGSKSSYSLAELKMAGADISNFLTLRRFIGNSEMGWKIAWSDRMVSMYTSLWLFGLIWWSIRKRLPRLPWWGLVLILLPMALDGITHFISDFSGIGQGFRDANLWLVSITGNAFRPGFYSGDAIGSFNSLMRLATGIFFGLGISWFLFPLLDETISDSV